MRCTWAESSEAMRTYHDTQWGVPCHDDQALFRLLVLELNQAGLSWQTILNKMATFDEAYDQFEIAKVAAYDEAKVAELLVNPGIIRNKLKVAAAITNAQQIVSMQAAGESFSHYIWSFTNDEVVDHTLNNASNVPSKTDLSDKLAKDLKKRGFRFVGSTTIYSFLQAAGVVNDHLVTCFRHAQVKE